MLKFFSSSAFSMFRKAVIALGILVVTGSFMLQHVTGDSAFTNLAVITGMAGGAFILLSSKPITSIFTKR